MDIKCPKCGEPWDNECIHEEAAEAGMEYGEVYKDFRRRGCAALSASCNGNAADPIIGEILDLLGDDVDGAMVTLEDAESLGLL